VQVLLWWCLHSVYTGRILRINSRFKEPPTVGVVSEPRQSPEQFTHTHTHTHTHTMKTNFFILPGTGDCYFYEQVYNITTVVAVSRQAVTTVIERK
jgi:hypothetical protein